MLEWRLVLAHVIDLAARDHVKRLPYRGGNDIAEATELGEHRVRHKMLLTTVYNQFRMELETDPDLNYNA
jgi:hypothetical protein